MRQIISFFIRYKFFLLFLLLEIIALALTIQSHSFHRSKFINSSNLITGYIYDTFSVIPKHNNVIRSNKELVEENARLKNLLAKKERVQNPETIVVDSTKYKQKYAYTNAVIINNVYKKSNNILTIDKGKKDGVFKDLGVINSNGVIGIVSNNSENYATVMSILNENVKINARLKKNIHFGTLTWDGKDYKVIQFEDLPRQANIKVGDTIITDGKSTIFPEGIPVGKIKDFELSNNNYQTINIELFNDMSAIKHVYVVTNLDRLEIKELESTNE